MLAGFAHSNITPAPDVYLAGNGEFQSEGIHDPLFARAMVLADGDEWVAVVSCDLIGIELETTQAVRRRLREAGCGRPENLILSCTHTHNGPHTRFSKTAFLKYRDDDYLDRLSERIAAAVIEADAAREPVFLRHARGWCRENFNRRVIAPDGTSHFYNARLVRENPEFARQTCGVTDRELDALEFLRRDGSPAATLVHYAAHPLTVGLFANVISADYCGAVVRELQNARSGAALFFQGACGDLHCKGLFAGFDRMEAMGRTLCAESLRILAAVGPDGIEPRLACARRELVLPTVLDSSSTPGGTNSAKKNSGNPTVLNPALFAGGYQAEMIAVSLGPVAFVSVPGELLCEPGLQIKCNSPFAQTWLLYNGNSYASYIAHRRACIEGGYEGDTGRAVTPEACEIVVATAADLLRTVFGRPAPI